MEKHSHKATGSFVSTLGRAKRFFSDPYLGLKKKLERYPAVQPWFAWRKVA